MPGTVAEVIEAVLEPLRQVANCITHARLVTCGFTPNELHTVTFGGGQDEIALRTRAGARVSLLFAHSFRATLDQDSQSWRVHSAHYMYTLSDADGREVVSYHWHPDSERSPLRDPHVKIPAATRLHSLERVHFPTGRISFESVVRFAIDELDVVPIANDYAQRLDVTEAEFRRTRSWA